MPTRIRPSTWPRSLFRWLRGGLARAFFVNSGSEANDTIVKLVWYYNNARGLPEKKKIISRNKAYHGTTALAASLSGLPHMHKAFDLPLAEIRHTMCPHFYRFGEAGESEEDFATRCADALEEMILEEGPETVAAFVAEPVMGGGGAHRAAENLLREGSGGAAEVRCAFHRG